MQKISGPTLNFKDKVHKKRKIIKEKNTLVDEKDPNDRIENKEKKESTNRDMSKETLDGRLEKKKNKKSQEMITEGTGVATEVEKNAEDTSEIRIRKKKKMNKKNVPEPAIDINENTKESTPVNENPNVEHFPRPVLQAFPTFLPQKLTAFDIAAKKSMGIPEWLAHPTIVTPETTMPISKFDQPHLLSKRLLRRCKDLGIEDFFAVQTAVIPIFLKSRKLSGTHRSYGDLCVSAPTGSGKTLAYVLPIIEILSKRIVRRLRALVILPTRDLVIQVKETFDAFCKGTDLKIGTATGQHSFSYEQAHLIGELNESLAGGSSKVDILIATPGRLVDHMNDTRNFSLQHLRFLVIDEADRLLNQSYQDWLANILRATHPSIIREGSDRKPFMGVNVNSDGIPVHDAIAPAFINSTFEMPISDIDTPKFPSIQKLLFSATLTRNPAKIASLHLQDPQYIAIQAMGEIDREDAIDERYTTPAGLREHMLVCPSDQKPLLVLHLALNMQVTAALCFTKSVESAHRLFLLIQLFEKTYLKKTSEDDNPERSMVAEYSSDLSQTERNTILKRFKKGKIQLLICSDLIARGIDLDCVDAVISYDVPVYMKKYIHRIGRTARAGREGDAYTLVETQEARHFKEMLSKAGHLDKVKKINWTTEQVEGLIETYQKSLEALKVLMTNTRSSLAKYQSRMQDGEEEHDNDKNE